MIKKIAIAVAGSALVIGAILVVSEFVKDYDKKKEAQAYQDSVMDVIREDDE